MLRTTLLAVCLLPVLMQAQRPPGFSPEVQEFISVDVPLVALTHVHVIDGTGRVAREDQTVVIANGKIADMGPTATIHLPKDAKVLDRTGYTVIPGLVGMHDHMFYDGAPALWSYSRLYLALGVTTLRTTGASQEPFVDLNYKRLIDTGRVPGPKINVSSPHLTGEEGYPGEIHLTGPDQARKEVQYWADEGIGSIKIYTSITRAELAAATTEAHKRHLTITAHLCSLTFREAAELGIDNLEHGFIVATDFVPDKKPDICPVLGNFFQPEDYYQPYFLKVDPNSPAFQDLVHTLIFHHVAITSTLPTFEGEMVGRPVLDGRQWDIMSPNARNSNMWQEHTAPDFPNSFHRAALKKEMELERAFAAAGGILMSGPDPPGGDFVLGGFGDLRGVELLVEAGFTLAEAIRISTANGADFLGYHDRGTLEPGKTADLVLIHGDPAKDIKDIEKVETVFKDGVGYDSAQLIESVRGQLGMH
jgi:imidazolonepropionase-like amidohydrolase